MPRHQLAQLNIAELKAPIDSPELEDFVDNLDRINALAESSPGFVWRLTGEGNDATSLRPLGEKIIVNMSVWQNVSSLRDFVYNGWKGSLGELRAEALAYQVIFSLIIVYFIIGLFLLRNVREGRSTAA